MSTESAIALYLKDVLGIHKPLFPQSEMAEVSESTEKQIHLLFIAPQNLGKSEEQLLKKIAMASPHQPVEVLRVDPLWGRNEIEKRIMDLSPQKAIIFGEKVFHVIKGEDSNFFEFINSSFHFAKAQMYASHELIDMCKGPNVNVLKKQVWQQLKKL